MQEKHEYIEMDVYETLPKDIVLNIYLYVDNSRCSVTVVDSVTGNGSGIGERLFDGHRWEGILDCIVTNIIRVIRENKNEGIS